LSVLPRCVAAAVRRLFLRPVGRLFPWTAFSSPQTPFFCCLPLEAAFLAWSRFPVFLSASCVACFKAVSAAYFQRGGSDDPTFPPFFSPWFCCSTSFDNRPARSDLEEGNTVHVLRVVPVFFCSPSRASVFSHVRFCFPFDRRFSSNDNCVSSAAMPWFRRYISSTCACWLVLIVNSGGGRSTPPSRAGFFYQTVETHADF